MTSKTPKFDAWVERRWGKRAPERLCEVCRTALATDPVAGEGPVPDDVTVDPRLLWTEERPKLDGPPPATPLCPAGHPMVEFKWTDGGARLYSCPQCDRA